MEVPTPRFVPLSIVAQVLGGATVSGVSSLLSHPALAPLWGALAALVIALVQAGVRRLNGKRSPADVTEDQLALQLAAAEAAKAAVTAMIEAQRAASAPARPTVAPPPPAGLLAILGLAAALTLGGQGCALSARDAARVTLQAVAAAADSAGGEVLDGYCVSQLRAAGRAGRRDAGGRCVAQGPERAATPDERAQVARVRADWAPVLTAHATLADAHTLAADILETADGLRDGEILGALGRLADAYAALARAVGRFGVRLPTLTRPEVPMPDGGPGVEPDPGPAAAGGNAGGDQ